MSPPKLAGQTNVNELAGALADHVHSEELAAPDFKDILIIPSFGVTDDLGGP
jgi:hypothetical protein